MPDDRLAIELSCQRTLELLKALRSKAQTEAQRTSQAEEINRILGDSTYVSLTNTHIGSEEVAALAKALKTNRTATYINLGLNHIGPEGAIALAEALKTNGTITKINLCSNHIGPVGGAALAEALKKNIDVIRLSITDPDDIGITARGQISQRLDRNRVLKTFSENLSSSINKDYDIRFERMGLPEAFKRPPLSPRQARVAFEENVIRYLTTPAPGREHYKEQLPALPLEMHLNIAAHWPLLQRTPLPRLKEATLKSRFFERFNGERLTPDARGALEQKFGTKEKSFIQAMTERRAQATSRQP